VKEDQYHNQEKMMKFRFSTKSFFSTFVKGRRAKEYIGQPTYETHPHLISSANMIVPEITKEEFQQRRQRLSDLVSNQTLVFVSSYQQKTSHDTETSKFVQDSTFSYLFGFHQPTSIAVLLPKGNFILFCQDTNANLELWTGAKCGYKRACDYFDCIDSFDINTAIENGQLKKIVSSSNNQPPIIVSKDVLFKNHIDQSLLQRVLSALNDGNIASTAATSLGDEQKKPPERAVLEIIDRMRLTKSEPELKLMRLAGDITSYGHLYGMKQSLKSKSERKLQAEVEHGFHQLNPSKADGTFFNSIIAGGSRACTLHYTSNDCLLDPNEFVLIDAGARLMGIGYGGDVTRTFPLNGKFSPVQKQVYEMVLDVQTKVIQAVDVGIPLSELQTLAVDTFSTHLDQLIGPIADTEQRKLRTRKYFPHGISHFLGLDVHDTPTVGRTVPLPENSVITVEPGLYFPENDETLPSQLRGIGIRIEDNVVVKRGKAAEVITRKYAPVQANEIEAVAGTN
jgi:Xaa-Pro aminopeptidase